MSASQIDNSKVIGTSAIKTQLESSLTTENTGLELTVGATTYRWNGTSFDTISISGAGLIYATPTQAVNVSDVDPAALATHSALIYSGTAVGNTETAVTEDYTDWTFHVLGVDADDDITVQVTFDGTNYVKPGLINIESNAYINQTAANIEVAGAYKFGVAAGVFIPKLALKKIKIVRETAVGSNTVTVWATGRN